MEVPQTFRPNKNFDEKLRKMTKLKMEELIEEEIGGYYRGGMHFPLPFKYIKSEIKSEYTNYCEPGTWSEIELTILEFKEPVKLYLQELADELEKGIFKNFQEGVCCLIKQEFAIIIKAYYDPEGLEAFKRHYRTKFGFY